MSRSNAPWNRSARPSAAARASPARCAIAGTAALLAALAWLAVARAAEFEVADGSAVLTRMLATPLDGSRDSVPQVAAMFLLTGRGDESQTLSRYLERRLVVQVLGEPPPVHGTVADALAYERGDVEPVDALVERALATLTAEPARSTGDEPLHGFSTAPDIERRYEGNSVWRVVRDPGRDDVYLRLSVTNHGALAVQRLSGSAALVGGDGRRYGPLGCSSQTRIEPGETRDMFCQKVGERGLLADLPAAVASAWAGDARFEFVPTLAAYPALGDLQLYPHMQAGSGGGYEANRALQATTCRERGSCGSDVGGVLVPAAPWLGLGLVGFGALALLLGRRLAYRDAPRLRLARYAANTALWVIGGAALGIVVARSAAPSYHLGWLPLLSGAGLGFALSSPANAAPLVLCAAVCEVALIPLFRSIGVGGFGGLAIAAIMGIAGAVLAVPSLLACVVLGLRMLGDPNLRTPLNKTAVSAGLAAPALVIGSLFML